MKEAWVFFAKYLKNCTRLAEPTKFDVALIEAIMLWPDDENWRGRAALSSYIEYAGDVAAVSPRPIDRLVHQKMARRAFPIEAVQEEVKKERFVRGTIAGKFLLKSVIKTLLKEDNQKQSMASIARDCLGPFLKAGYRVQMKTWDNEIWPTFRPVAHFWAASIMLKTKNTSTPFPCDYHQFAEFLADAEFFRVEGERLRTPNSPTKVLRYGEAFTLPENLRVQPSEFEVSTG